MPDSPVGSHLTRRESELLRLLVEGVTTTSVLAAAMCVSENTIKFHTRHAYKRLGVHDRTQAAVWAIRHGIAS